MMEVIISKDDANNTSVDRDGVLNQYGTQGFYIRIGGVTFHFEDENDVAKMAVMVCKRLGVSVKFD